jgi:hypothetical protein
MKTKFPQRRLFTILVAFVSAFVCGSAAFAASKPIMWKANDRAILKVTGMKPPKSWSILEDEKQKSRVLVQMDNHYVLLDAKTKQAFEMSPSQIRAHGKNYESINPADTEKPLPSEDWDMRDIGPAERIQARLTTNNVLLDVELPHPLNLHIP